MLYLLQVNLYTAVMVAIYLLFLRNRTVFRFARYYLLASAILPLVLPFIALPQSIQQQLPMSNLSISLPEVIVNGSIQQAIGFGIVPFVWAIGYSIVALIFLLPNLVALIKVKKVINLSIREKHDGYSVIRNSGYGPGSVGKYIFFPGDEVNETILAHERAHICLHHTRDIILLSLLQALLWPNVLLLWIKKEIKEVHEFQADALINTHTQDYAALLLGTVFNTRSIPVMNQFIIHPIKRRIMMLQKKNKAPVWKTTTLVAASTCLFLFTALNMQSCSKKTSPAGNVPQSGHVIIDDGPDAKGVYKTADVMPKPVEDLQEYLVHNLVYPASARKNGIQGRVIVKFTVDENGNIVNPTILKSPDSSLSNEAVRVISKMSKWTPAEKNGKKVPVYFVLPVSFQLSK